MTVDKEFIPPATADYTPFATKLKGADPNWAFAYAPWPTEVKTFEALRRLRLDRYLSALRPYPGRGRADAHCRCRLQVFTVNALFQDDLPVQKEMREMAAQGKYSYPATYADEAGSPPAHSSRSSTKTGWPASAEKIAAAMKTLDLDTQGLRGGPLVWTADNHFRTKQYYRFYRYDPDKKSIVRMRDWLAVDVVN